MKDVDVTGEGEWSGIGKGKATGWEKKDVERGGSCNRKGRGVGGAFVGGIGRKGGKIGRKPNNPEGCPFKLRRGQNAYGPVCGAVVEGCMMLCTGAAHNKSSTKHWRKEIAKKSAKKKDTIWGLWTG